MLKKAGIVVAAVAAGLLAVSPLAFAGDYSDNHSHKGHPSDFKSKEAKKNSEGIIKVENNNINTPFLICSAEVDTKRFQTDLTGALAIWGKFEHKGQSGDVRECVQKSHAEQSNEQPIEQSVEN